MLTLWRHIFFIKWIRTSEFIQGHIFIWKYYWEVAWSYKTFRSPVLITTLTYILMDNFCPCFLLIIAKSFDFIIKITIEILSLAMFHNIYFYFTKKKIVGTNDKIWQVVFFFYIPSYLRIYTFLQYWLFYLQEILDILVGKSYHRRIFKRAQSQNIACNNYKYSYLKINTFL